MSIKGCEECGWRGWIECAYFRYEIPESGTAVQTCDECKGDDIGDIDAALLACEYMAGVPPGAPVPRFFIGWHGTGSIDDKDGIAIAEAGDVWITMSSQDAGAHPVDELECIDEHADSPCSGMVEYRMPLSGTGRAFPRCDRHWSVRLDREEVIRGRYPHNAPADFDPAFAGESWEES